MALKGGIVDASGEKISSIRLVTDADANAGLGDALDPLRVDPTGTTVQPVSFSSPQHVIVDSGGGGGTQYAEGTTQATATGTVALGKNASNVVSALPLTANGLKTDGSAVTQPVSIAAAVTVQQATAANLKVDLSGTAANATAIKVDGSAVTQPVSIAALKEDPAGNLLISGEGKKATYRASSGGISSLGNGELVYLSGSATKKVKVTLIKVSLRTSGTAPLNASVVIQKYSTLPTAGTPVTDTAVPLDSGDGAATAVTKHFTALPTSGSLVGQIDTFAGLSPTVVSSTSAFGAVLQLEYRPSLHGAKPITLNNANENVAINAVNSGFLVDWVWEWTEE